MKIPGSDGDNNQIKRLNDEGAAERLKRGATPKRPESLSDALGQEGSAAPSSTAGGVSDRFISSKLGLKIREELDPAKMLQERREKIERIKEQVRSGSYSVDADKVARSVGEEISLELLFSGGLAASE
jgi:anti-sigma28 factor (negative regulator of flagellin synthesis)